MDGKPQRESKFGLGALIACAVAGLFVASIAICFGISSFAGRSMQQELTEKVRERFSTHPIVREQLGEIQSIVPRAIGESEPNTFHLEIRGSKATGQIEIDQVLNHFDFVELTTPQGKWDLLKSPTAIASDAE